jgi:antigen flippase
LKQILRATAIMGSSSLVTILSGALKSKLIALLLGPGGIGLLGLLQSVMTTTATLTSAGLGGSAVREVAMARGAGDERRLAGLRRTLLVLGVLLGLLGGLALVLLREHLALLVFDDPSMAWMVACLGAGVTATTLSNVMIGWINGYRLIGAIARINLWSSLASLPLSCAAVWLWGTSGLVVVALAPPLIMLAVSWRYSPREPLAAIPQRQDYLPIAGRLLRLGASIMLTALLTVTSQFVARLLISQRLGLEAAGQFQAAWSISMLYVGFALGAMVSDYYPRLAEVTAEPERLTALINQQALLLLYLLGPAFLLLYVGAPLLLRLLYSGDFGEAAGVLRWQVAGDLFKVQSWAFAFALLARGQSLAFLLVEMVWSLTYLLLLWLGLERWGLQASGIAFVLAYLLYDALVWLWLKVNLGYAIDRQHLRALLLIGGGLAGVMLAPAGLLGALAQGLIVLLVPAILLFQIKDSLATLPWRRLLNRKS